MAELIHPLNCLQSREGQLLWFRLGYLSFTFAMHGCHAMLTRARDSDMLNSEVSAVKSSFSPPLSWSLLKMSPPCSGISTTQNQQDGAEHGSTIRSWLEERISWWACLGQSRTRNSWVTTRDATHSYTQFPQILGIPYNSMPGSQLVAKSTAWLPSCFVEWHLDHGFPLDFQYFYLGWCWAKCQQPWSLNYPW